MRSAYIRRGFFVLAILLLIIFGKMTKEEDRKDPVVEIPLEESSEDSEMSEIYVHIDGAVKQPGVYTFSPEDRIEDAVKRAGGLREDSDITSINLAKHLEDEMKIHIPTEGEIVASGGETTSGKIDLNSASLEKLMELPSVGEKRAKDIIAYREKKPFSSIDELREVPGIGDKTFEKLADLVVVP